MEVGSILSENGTHRFMYWNAWSLVVGTVWRRLGGVALLKKCVTGGGGFEVSGAHHRLRLSISLLFVDQEASSKLVLQHHPP